jgi:hypothetical protein
MSRGNPIKRVALYGQAWCVVLVDTAVHRIASWYRVAVQATTGRVTPFLFLRGEQ